MASRACLTMCALGAWLTAALCASQSDCRASDSSTCGTDPSSKHSTHTSPLLQTQKAKVTTSLHKEAVGERALLGKRVETSESWNKYITETKSVMYGTQNKLQISNIYTPQVDAPPNGWLTVIAIHGVGGNVNSFKTVCTMIAKTGRQCITISYHALGKSFAGMVECASGAIDYYSKPDIASKYNIDTGRIVLYGCSRGGFITGELLWNPAFDTSRVRGGIIGNGIWKKHYPYIEEDKHASNPVLLLSTSDDKIVQKKYAEEAAKKLLDRGVDVEHVIYPRGGHSIKNGVASMFEHISDYLERFEDGPAPLVGTTEQWPSVCKMQCMCLSAGTPFTATSRTACQDAADELGHRYIQWVAAEKLCATSSTCDDSSWSKSGKFKVEKKWMIYWRPVPITSKTVGSVTPPTEEAATPSTPSPTEPPTMPPPPPPPAPPPRPPTKTILCRDDCAPSKQDWTKKCKWHRCKECAECGTPETPEPTSAGTENRFCVSDCAPAKQEWKAKCKWNRCKQCPLCDGSGGLLEELSS